MVKNVLVMQKAKQRGVILLLALVTVSVCATLALWMRMHMNTQISRLESERKIEQVQRVRFSVEQMVRHALISDAQKNDYDHAKEPWSQMIDVPIPSKFIPQLGEPDGVQLSGVILDESGKLNLGVLLWSEDGDPEVQKLQVVLFNLCKLLGIEGVEIDGLISRMSYYNYVNPAHPIYRLEDLQRLGWRLDDLLRLKHYVTIGPKRFWRMNINFMNKIMLRATFEDLSEKDVELIEQLRTEQGGFANELQINNVLLGQVTGWRSAYVQMLQTKSDMFMMHVSVTAPVTKQTWNWKNMVYRMGDKVWIE